MRRLSCAIVAVLIACGPATRTADRTGAPSPDKRVSIDRATWQTRAAFDAAVRTGDTARIAGLFAPDAFLIAPSGDSIRGPDAIARYLAQQAPAGALVSVSFGREGSLEACVGAAREQLTYSARLSRSDGTSSTAAGRLSVFWQRDATGELKVAWIAFPKSQMKRRLSPAECPSVADSVRRSWRWAATAFVAPGLPAGGPAASFENVLRGRGWVDQDCCRAIPRYTPASQWSFVVPPSLVAIQYHARPHVVTELAAGRLPKGTTMGAQEYPNRDYAQIRLWYSGAFVEALVSYERWGIQVGAGPVVQFAHWRLRDSLIPYSTGGYPTYTNITWSRAAIGVVGDVRYHRLVGTRTFLALRTQLRRFPKARTLATPRFPAAAVDQGSSMVGAGFGVIF